MSVELQTNEFKYLNHLSGLSFIDLMGEAGNNLSHGGMQPVKLCMNEVISRLKDDQEVGVEMELVCLWLGQMISGLDRGGDVHFVNYTLQGLLKHVSLGDDEIEALREGIFELGAYAQDASTLDEEESTYPLKKGYDGEEFLSLVP